MSSLHRPCRMEHRNCSVVIPTRGRQPRLHALLESLEHSGRDRIDQVVVVDDTPGPREEARFEGSLPIATVRSSERMFIARARNTGASRTQAEFLAFVDDDNCVTPGLLERLVLDLERDTNLGAVMPAVLYKRRPDLVWVYATPFRRDRWGFDLIGRNLPRNPDLEDRIVPTDALPNFCVTRRSAFDAVGGYDEGFPVNASADLCQRFKRAGWQVRADTGAFTLHDVEPPGVPGYWAEHAVADPDRMRYEVADWFRFHRIWNGAHTFFAAEATYHALGFLLPTSLALFLRAGTPRLRLLTEIVRGYRLGLRAPLTRRLGRAGQ